MNKLLRSNSKKLLKLTDKLCKRVFGSCERSDELCADGCTINELNKFCKYFPNYQIIVWNDILMHKAAYFRSKKQKKTNQFILYN